jgi:hypothetical protein
MSKHMYSDNYHKEKPIEWFTPVELISAHESLNIESIWN